jgi:hypothetical protein
VKEKKKTLLRQELSFWYELLTHKYAIMAYVSLLCMFALSYVCTTPIGVCNAHRAGFSDLIIQKINACSLAKEMLGDDIGYSYRGLSFGVTRTVGDFGVVTWELPVSGERGHGKYSFHLERHGGKWQMYAGELIMDDKLIDIVSCKPIRRSRFD